MTGAQLPENLRYVDLPPGTGDETFSKKELAILDSVNRRVAAEESVEEMIDFLFESTRNICPCDRIGLAFIEEADDQVTARSHYVRADYEPILLGQGYGEALRGSSLWGVLESGLPRIINDLEQYIERKPESVSTRTVLREGVRSSLTVPLIVDDRAVGFLFRSSRKPNVYTNHHVVMARTVAERLAQAVEKARRIGQLNLANEAYREMLRFVSHELKSPVAASVMDAQTLLGGYLGDLTSEQAEKVQSIVSRSNYLLGLIRDYLNLDRIERGGAEPEIKINVDFPADVIEPSVEVLAPQISERRIEIEKDWDGEIGKPDCDPELMRIILVNLVGNAIKYGNEGGRLRLRCRIENERFSCSVWNEGVGFPPEEAASLFQRFRRVQTPELLRRGGTGVGLYTVWRIMQQHGGRVWADSREGEWAEFCIEWPLRIKEVN